MTSLALETRKKRPIGNHHDTSAVVAGQNLAAQALKTKYPAALHRPTPVCYTYNCHGLTFAARRTQVTASDDVRRILQDDDYVQVSRDDVLPGDVVLYVNKSGEIEHSGVVVSVDRGTIVPTIKVLSKWGSAHEVVHNLLDCPYRETNIEFYRVAK